MLLLTKKEKLMRKIYLLDLMDLANEFLSKRKSEEWSRTTEEFDSQNYTSRTEKWVSPDGTSSYTRTIVEPKRPKVDVKWLESKLKKAIESEEYELAAVIRDQITEAKKEG